MAELSYIGEMSDEDRRISEAVVREQGRLRNFVRKYVSDQSDVEDILQDVFYEFVAAFRMLRPVEHATAWLFRVARNRIIDRFRGKTRDVLRNAPGALKRGNVTLARKDPASVGTNLADVDWRDPPEGSVKTASR